MCFLELFQQTCGTKKCFNIQAVSSSRFSPMSHKPHQQSHTILAGKLPSEHLPSYSVKKSHFKNSCLHQKTAGVQKIDKSSLIFILPLRLRLLVSFQKLCAFNIKFWHTRYLSSTVHYTAWHLKINLTSKKETMPSCVNILHQLHFSQITTLLYPFH